MTISKVTDYAALRPDILLVAGIEMSYSSRHK